MVQDTLLSTGAAAQKMHVSVRTLQYYDKIGLLRPQGRSAGGRRRYNNQDLVKLHQILTMKYLGFSLEEIKARIGIAQTPGEVLKALEGQRQVVHAQREQLDKALAAIDVLSREIRQMAQVDWQKYADIVALLREENEQYWIVKYFDSETLETVSRRFDEASAKAFVGKWEGLCKEIVALEQQGETPEGAAGRALAGRWWDMVTEFTQGDMKILDQLVAFNDDRSGWNERWRRRQEEIDAFIQRALNAYFASLGVTLPQQKF